jgi:hypothetical protein
MVYTQVDYSRMMILDLEESIILTCSAAQSKPKFPLVTIKDNTDLRSK